MQPHNRTFSAYKNALSALSSRTRTPLPSLVLSFGILHEITAVMPLVGVFYGSRALGIGEGIVNRIISGESASSNEENWSRKTARDWVEEGDAWASRVGKRYGIFGYKQTAPEGEASQEQELLQRQSNIAGDVANAVVAYGVTKALLPVRIGLSLYLSPAFSRGIIEPITKASMRLFRRNR